MTQGPYRITRNTSRQLAFDTESDGGAGGLADYIDRLLRLIPSEVVGLYLVGSGVIPDEQAGAHVAWSIFCFFAVIASRYFGTRSSKDPTPQWPTIVISSISFVVWLYAIGGPFVDLGWHVGWIGSLMVLAWTFIVPLVYDGDPEDPA